MKLLFSDGTSVEVEGAKVPESFAEDGSDVFPVPECIFTYDPLFFERESKGATLEQRIKFLDFAHYLHWDEKFFSHVINLWNSLSMGVDDYIDSLRNTSECFTKWWILKMADTHYESNFLYPHLGDKPYYQEACNIFKFMRRENYPPAPKLDDFQFEWETPSLLPFIVQYEKSLHPFQFSTGVTSSHFFEIFKGAFSIFSEEEEPTLFTAMAHMVELVRRLLPVIGNASEKTLNSYFECSSEEKTTIPQILMNPDFIQKFPDIRKEILSRKWALLLCADCEWTHVFSEGVLSFFEYVRGGSISFLLLHHRSVKPFTFKCRGGEYTLILGEPDEDGTRVILDIVGEE